MTQPEPPQPGAITLDQLIALNDEIAALARAGVPLESALAELGGDLPGRLGKTAAMLAERAGRGESLAEVLAQQSAAFPPVYRAVVEAGLRAGRLPAALEAVAGSLRRVAETRRGVAAAALYPMLVVILAWVLFAFFAAKIAPSLLDSFDRLDVAQRGLFGWLDYYGRWAVYWGPAIPLILAFLAALWWHGSGRATLVQPHWAGRLLGWLPWMGQTLRWSRAATFSEVLALLVESRVPLPEALLLAGEACGDPRMVTAARQVADALRRGDPPDGRKLDRGSFPPLLCWLMAAGQRHGVLGPALRHAAETYQRRAEHQAHLARVFLPVVLTLAIGGSVTLMCALILFGPYTSMLKALGGA